MDTDLVVRAQQGDRGAFAEIADETLDRFLAIAHRIVSEPPLHPGTFTSIAPILELPARDGEVRWMSFLDIASQ